MYLNETTPFVYRISYDKQNFSFIFYINEKCAELTSLFSKENLILRYVKEKLGYTSIETDLLKNFGVTGTSINQGIKNGKITLVFPIKSEITITDKLCERCHGEKTDFLGHDCWDCKKTGYIYERKSNIYEVAVSIQLLSRYLNFCLVDENCEKLISTAKGEFQHIYLETGINTGNEGGMRSAPIGGECSDKFFSLCKNYSQEEEDEIRKQMCNLECHLANQDKFPDWEFHVRPFEFRCEVNEEGGFYIEVPGINGCNVYRSTHGYSRNDFTCHNIDTPHQQIELLSGFAMLSDFVYNNLKLETPPV